MSNNIQRTSLALLLCLGSAISISSHAGDNSQHSPEQRIERMSKKLQLDEQQQQQLRQVFDNNRSEREALRQQMKALKEKTDAEIRSFLNPEQIAKLDNMAKKRLQRREESASKRDK